MKKFLILFFLLIVFSFGQNSKTLISNWTKAKLIDKDFISGKLIKYIPENSKFELIEPGEKYSKIKHQKDVGFILNYYLTKNNNLEKALNEIGLEKEYLERAREIEAEKLKRRISIKTKLMADSLRKIYNKNISEFQNTDTRHLIGIPKGYTKIFDSPSYTGIKLNSCGVLDTVYIIDFKNDYYLGVVKATVGYFRLNVFKEDQTLNEFKEYKTQLAKKELQKKLKLAEVKKIRERKAAEKKELDNFLSQLSQSQKNTYYELTKKFPDYSIKVYEKLLYKIVFIGMSRSMAEYCIGKPNKKTKHRTEYGTSEKWIYDDLELYFNNYTLKSITEYE